jgi:hypothetical protein
MTYTAERSRDLLNRIEPQEREDPRNRLLDAFDEYVDALVRHELVPIAVSRLEGRHRGLANALAAFGTTPIATAAALEEARQVALPPSTIEPALPAPAPAPAPIADPVEDSVAAELELTRRIAALNMAHPKNPGGRMIVEAAKADALAALQALTATRRARSRAGGGQ